MSWSEHSFFCFVSGALHWGNKYWWLRWIGSSIPGAGSGLEEGRKISGISGLKDGNFNVRHRHSPVCMGRGGGGGYKTCAKIPGGHMMIIYE